MTTVLKVKQPFDTYKVGDALSLPDSVAQALQNAYPGRYEFVSNDSGNSGLGSGPTSGTSTSASGALAPVLFQLTAVTSYAATHAFPYSPPVLLIDASGAQVETDVSYAGSQVLLTFPTPFTGTLWLG